MDKKIFSETAGKIRRYVSEHRLHDAFGYAQSLAQAVGSYPDRSELEQLEQNYRMLLMYAAQGAEDPHRSAMVAGIGSGILGVVDRLERKNLLASEPTLYYNTLRYEQMQRSDSIASLLTDYVETTADMSLFNAVSMGQKQPQQQQKMLEREQKERRIFNRIWVTYPLSAADEEAIGQAMGDDRIPAYARELFAWAIILGGLQYHDSARVGVLVDLYGSETMRLSTVGLIGLCLLLNAHPERELSRNVSLRLAALRDRKEWGRDIRMAALELAKTIDTDRITAKIRDELVPGMMKLKPEIDKKIKLGIEELDPTEMEENPEWQEMIHKTGLDEKLKEMSEIQEEGGDVMMGTFAHLKSFPFFNDVANWFLPFHTDYSLFSDGKGGSNTVADIMYTASFLCDSDKYSFMISLGQVPEAQRRLMMQQLEEHDAQLAELRASTLSAGNADRRSVVNKQIQNAFRFFRLFRRKGEMPNPFADGVNLAAKEPFAADLRDEDTLNLIAEFYFGHGYYAQALALFGILAEESNADAALYQKMGHARQKLGDYAGAVADYERAEMLDGNSDWTLRRLARCYMALHRPEEALRCLRTLEAHQPDSAAVSLNIGRCLVELERYDEAVKAYFKSEYLAPDSTKALRPLAWCLLVTGDIERSRKYYEKVIERTEPQAVDYLNLGHLSIADGKYKEAMNFYRLNISARMPEGSDGSTRKDAIDAFIADVVADMKYLTRLGADAELVSLLIDSVLYDY